MKTIRIANGEIQASEISLGCMRLPGLSGKEAEVFVQTALDEGINFFDHADIYAGGKSEELFAHQPILLNEEIDIDEVRVVYSVQSLDDLHVFPPKTDISSTDRFCATASTQGQF